MNGSAEINLAAPAAPRTVGVLICSYRRPAELLRCLAALERQDRAPDVILVVARKSDGPTVEAVRNRPGDWPVLRLLTVGEPGKIYALNRGLAAIETDVVAICDDDTIAHPHWLRSMMQHFIADQSVGGVGGRDWWDEGHGFDARQRHDVGRMQWFGRLIGNHHLGAGPAREVDFLKGANMGFRRQAITNLRFDERLRGDGAQPAEDIAFSCAVKHSGWKLIYDPVVSLDHLAGPRDEPRHYVGVAAREDRRGLEELAFNEILAIWDVLPWPRRIILMIWSLLVGTGMSPGLVQAIRYTPRLGRGSWMRFAAACRGKIAAFRALCLAGGTAPAQKVSS